eukprot:3181459-Rhodomonas_salina.7
MEIGETAEREARTGQTQVQTPLSAYPHAMRSPVLTACMVILGDKSIAARSACASTERGTLICLRACYAMPDTQV